MKGGNCTHVDYNQLELYNLESLASKASPQWGVDGKLHIASYARMCIYMFVCRTGRLYGLELKRKRNGLHGKHAVEDAR